MPQRPPTVEEMLPYLQQWVNSLPAGERSARLARVERAMRAGQSPDDRLYLKVVVAWRLAQQLRG